MKLPAPNRIAVGLAAVAGAATAIVPSVANMDTHSTSAVIAGGTVIVTAFLAWLKGWQAHETRESWKAPGGLVDAIESAPEPSDEVDDDSAGDPIDPGAVGIASPDEVPPDTGGAAQAEVK